MNILVCLKQVPDTETKIQVKSDGSGIETAGIKWVMNPYDEFAVEEALKLRDKFSDGSKVTVYSLGPKARVVEALRTSLAMGADDAVVIDAPENLDSNSVAKALASALKKEADVGIVFTGKQAIDDDCSQVSQLLAEYLGFSHATVVVKFEAAADKSSFTVEREVEGGAVEVIQLQKPAVIAAQKGLNNPRYASLPGIMKAKKKEIKEVSFASLGVTDSDKKTNYKNYQLPPGRPAAKILEGDVSVAAAQIVKLLREEAKVV